MSTASLDIELLPNYFNNIEFDYLKSQIPWKKEKIKIFGKVHSQPRLLCWMADEGLSYRYSGKTYFPEKWDEVTFKIKEKLQKDFALRFNSCLLNYYRNGQDHMGKHSDNEKELGVNPVIASLSFGASRDFFFEHIKTKEKVKLHLENGDLLIMKGKTQSHWKHYLPKRANTKARINLTFRKIYS